MPKPGDIIDNYLLKEQLGRKGYYIETWHATDERGADVILKFHYFLVHNDDASVNDLTQQVSALVGQIDRLVSLGPHLGIAPWLGYKFDRKQKYLLLIRRFYPHGFADRIPIPNTQAYLSVLDEIATGIDFIEKELIAPAEMVPTNLLMKDGHGYLTDFGLTEVHTLIEEGYFGPRPLKVMDLLMGKFSILKDQSVVFKFALLYFYLRTGRYALGNFIIELDTRVNMSKYMESLMDYRTTGKLYLDALSNPKERGVVARALTLDDPCHYLSCSEFMADIRVAQ